ncbi:MAG: SMP-30/gluconolactonase/LRE family protein [Gaiellaceae bacterium]
MKARTALLIAAAAIGLAGVAAGLVSAARSPFRPVTTFAPQEQFPEGLAVGKGGNLFVSVTDWKSMTGRVLRVSPAGARRTTGPKLPVGTGLLAGVALDVSGRLYVATATARAKPAPKTTPQPGVFRIGPEGSATRVLKLPWSSFPNGLAFDRGRLYVSDSALGAVWRVSTDGKQTLWLKSRLLAPKHGFGANGLAVWQGDLYVAVSDTGAIVRIPIEPGGAAGAPEVVVKRPLLRTVDGIAFDPSGALYAVTNTNRLLRLDSEGRLEQLAGPAGLAYPTSPAFARAGMLYVVNGALEHGTPGIVSFQASREATAG